jgi:hypothetical protein
VHEHGCDEEPHRHGDGDELPEDHVRPWKADAAART